MSMNEAVCNSKSPDLVKENFSHKSSMNTMRSPLRTKNGFFLTQSPILSGKYKFNNLIRFSKIK